MKNKKFCRDDIIKLLIKLANGFYYSEEQCEYEKMQNKSNLNKKQLDFNISTENYSNNVRGCTQLNFIDDIVKSSNEEQNNHDKKNENLTLVKKKVATHFISPDIHAVKILLEIFSEKVGDDLIENMSDEELLKLKNDLIGELLNEPNKNK